jgi:hypothetical protein
VAFQQRTLQDRLRGSEYFLPAFNIQARVELGNQVNSLTFNLKRNSI